MRIILCGAHGAMGKYVRDIVESSSDLSISAGVDRQTFQGIDFPQYNDFSQDIEGDVVIDFSHYSMIPSLLDFCEKKKCPAIICTTGMTEEINQRIVSVSKKIPIFHSGNMSIGIHLLTRLAKEAAAFLGPDFQPEIIEKHHNQKVDSPSGTAKMILQAVQAGSKISLNPVYGRKGNNTKRTPSEIGIHAIRGGTIVGEHDLIFAGLDEVIEIRHQAASKRVFAKGAVIAARFLVSCPPGLYDMNDIV